MDRSGWRVDQIRFDSIRFKDGTYFLSISTIKSNIYLYLATACLGSTPFSTVRARNIFTYQGADILIEVTAHLYRRSWLAEISPT